MRHIRISMWMKAGHIENTINNIEFSNCSIFYLKMHFKNLADKLFML